MIFFLQDVEENSKTKRQMIQHLHKLKRRGCLNLMKTHMSCPIMKRPMRMQIVSSQLLFVFVILFFFQICRNMSTSALCYSILNYFLIPVSRDVNNKFSVINYFLFLENL